MVEITREKIMEVLEVAGVEAWDLVSINEPMRVAFGIIADMILDEDWCPDKYWDVKERGKYGRRSDQ